MQNFFQWLLIFIALDRRSQQEGKGCCGCLFWLLAVTFLLAVMGAFR
jgi:hypothetical protein